MYQCNGNVHSQCQLHYTKCCICTDKREYAANNMYIHYIDGKKTKWISRHYHYCPSCYSACQKNNNDIEITDKNKDGNKYLWKDNFKEACCKFKVNKNSYSNSTYDIGDDVDYEIVIEI